MLQPRIVGASMGVSAKSFGARAMARRTIASFAFVLLCNPVDPILLKVQSDLFSLSIAAMLFQWGVILAVHAYLMNRARYALKLKGTLYFIILFTLFYVSLNSYFLGITSILGNAVLYLYGLLSFLYAYGLIFGPIDARLSGLVHTTEISR